MNALLTPADYFHHAWIVPAKTPFCPNAILSSLGPKTSSQWNPLPAALVDTHKKISNNSKSGCTHIWGGGAAD